MTHRSKSATPRWKLENGTPVTAHDLATEIKGVPRTKFWRLSHLAILWPMEADPDSLEKEDGFADGFVLELVPTQTGVDWLLQPVDADAQHRITGSETDGPSAVAAAFQHLDDMAEKRRKERERMPDASSPDSLI
ncbi:hypothetical protein GCM10007972_13930 [Iodidimonas muriae]|uniref:Uncharacterized protein n=1 Tax=Iodidimonas muriae TaxID=261467 RepID=A0ABQ2LCT0_9PROT|nr:hypothetical protein [Iodidimonas muriae]GER07370.1 hypothetical protein JCM17843_16800 [Kordiimonadales bacterium JCM 17843]GGO10780.1 hypothetical protein GCM10007972_13930 [Iodidimonas muriae]